VCRPLPDAVTVATIVARLGGEARGDATARIERLATLASADAGALGFLASRRHADAAGRSRASAMIVSPELAGAAPPGATLIVTPDPYLYYARVAQWFETLVARRRTAGIHPTASVAGSARLGEGVAIGPGAVVDEGATIGAGCDIGSGCYVGADTVVGESSRLHHNVTVYHGCTLGRRVIVHSGTVIGADGFGFAPSPQGWVKIAQLGGVTIGDDVEVGANCAIDRGALDDTVVGDGCKIDNLVQIAHNVRIGAGTAIAGCVGIAGSAVIGGRCMIGGGAGVLGHLEICDGVTISAMSLVTRSIREPGFYTGVFPLVPNDDWERIAASLKRLPSLRQRLRSMQHDRLGKDLP
jgi:UDP-3-O-[3-hydroxymyristoyl] glucosamine N-acyltransferase